MVESKYIELNTQGNTDVLNITHQCSEIVKSSEIKDGVLTVFNPGSTGSVTTIEYEPNLVKDLKEVLEKIAPANKRYHHHETWHDDNGHSHMRSTLMGPSLSVPFIDSELTLGTWQQIIFCDFDTKPRNRRLVLQLVGE